MNIKQGYKQTEIGIIPEDWEVKNFGDIIQYIKGFPFKSKDYESEGIRIIRVSDTNSDSIKTENGIFISEKRQNEFRDWRLEEYDLVFSTVGSKPPMYDSMVGKVIFVKNEFAGSFLNQNAVLIRAKYKTKFIQELLLNHFKTKRYLKHIEEIFRGNANQASITLEDLFKYKIPLPKDKQEQTAIATALSDIDALIGELDKLIAKKQGIKQATMQQLLTGKKRLAGFSGEWEVKRLGDVFVITAGGDLDKKNFSITKNEKHQFPVYSNSLSNNGLYGYSPTYSQEKNTITVTARGTVGFANARNHKYSAIGRVLILSPLEKVSCFFVAEYINNKISFANESTGVPQLTAPQISKHDIVIPSYEEQTAIANILSDMDAEISQLEGRRAKMGELKQGMMQELLTGRIRLTGGRYL